MCPKSQHFIVLENIKQFVQGGSKTNNVHHFQLTDIEQQHIASLFQKHYKKLYYVAYRHLSGVCVDGIDDVIQEVFKRACDNYVKLCSYDSQEAWLVQTCHNVALDEANHYLRQQNIDDFQKVATQRDSIDIGIDSVLPISISTDKRELLIRYYINGETTNEIAFAWNEKPATIRKRLSRVRSELRKLLKE